MDKVVMLNKDNAVVDIVDTVKPVKKTDNGITILCAAEEAQGYIGSDNETIYARIGMQFQPTYYDIAKMYMINEEDIPAVVAPLAYKYAPETGFTVNMDPYPDTNKGLTDRMSETEEILMDMSEIIYG